MQNKCFLFAEIPQALPVPGKHLRVRAGDFDLDAAPAEGGFTGRVLHASLDPYLRHRMVSADAARDGFEPLPVGSVIPNTCIIRVLQSKSPSLAPGDAVIGMAPIQEYVTVSADDAKQYTKIENPHGLALKMFLGPLGLPGLTAYSALYEVAKPQKGETIFISAALGAVGQMVGQLSKREGLNVIGSVGSDEKLKVLVEKLGYDAGFNYRHGDIEGQLKRLAPDGIDSECRRTPSFRGISFCHHIQPLTATQVHYDNVGGEQLDAAITLMKSHGRIGPSTYAYFRTRIQNLMRSWQSNVAIRPSTTSRPISSTASVTTRKSYPRWSYGAACLFLTSLWETHIASSTSRT